MASLDSWKQGTEENINEIHDCYCPNCSGGKAHTILLPTSIPMFREIYIMTLTCPDCNFKNSQVNFGGEIQRKGVKITLSLASPWDLNRQLVKSDSATLGIPALSFEIPPGTQRGTVSTIEGMMMTAARNLEALPCGIPTEQKRARVELKKASSSESTDWNSARGTDSMVKLHSSD